jgi:hypothetical protein
MKPLPRKLHRHGVFYEQVRRTEKVAMYSLRYTPVGPIIGFDVFRVLTRGERVVNGKTLPMGERFPPDSAFGVSAWVRLLKNGCRKSDAGRYLHMVRCRRGHGPPPGLSSK